MVLVVLWSAAGAAWAEGGGGRRIRLEYDRDPGAERCPDEMELRLGVMARLGRDPFAEDAATAVSCWIQVDGAGLRAVIDVGAAARVLTSPRRDCVELADAVELAIALAIEPAAAAPALPAVTPSPSLPPMAPLLPPEPLDPSFSRLPVVTRAAPPRAAGAPLVVHVGMAAFAALWVAPNVAPGVSIEAGGRHRDISFSVEGRADLPASTPAMGGSVSASLLLLSAVPCGHRGGLALCGLISAGALRSAGHDLHMPREATTPYLGVGARLAWQIQLGPALWARVHADMVTSLIATTLRVGGIDVWTTPFLGATTGLGVIGTF